MPRFLKSTFFVSIIALSFVAFGHTVALAQTVPGISEPITFDLIPQYPEPNQPVEIKAQSFSTDLDKAIFTWTVNGKVAGQGVGLKDVTIDGGAVGSLTVVSVSVATPDFGTIKNTFSFRPAEVTLLWQTDAHVPPFYKGKALEGYNGAFRVTALPEFIDPSGKRINPKDLIYTWKKNGEVQGDASGFGKDAFITSETSYMRPGEDVSVEVSSPKDSITGSADITISPAIPEVVLYEDSPLYGILYNHALDDSMNLKTQEISLKMEPFNTTSFATDLSDLSIDWTLNGASLPDFTDKDEITFRTTGDASGESDVGVLIQNRSKVLQGGKAKLAIFQ